MNDQEVNGTEATEGAEPATVELNEVTNALYMSFQGAALEAQAKNSNVADASILLLAEVLANMTEASTLPQDDYNGVMGQVLAALRGFAVQLSHDIAATVAEVKYINAEAGEVTVAAGAKEELN